MNEKLFKKIEHYVSKNIDKSILQNETADLFNISPQYLARLFRANTGMTFKAYINSLRNHKTIPVADNICSTQPDSILKSETVSVSSDNYGIRSHCWNKLINLGYASSLKSLHIEPAIRMIQSQIHFKYGRICRITDLINIRTSEGDIIYDYSDAFALLDLLIENDMHPFFEIGHKVFFIQKTNTDFSSENNDTVSSYYADLIKVLPNFLKTCINRYGRKEVNEWRFEISYMYFGLGEELSFTFHDYIVLFRKLYNLIHSISPLSKVGGPGFNKWENETDIYTMLSYFNNAHISPDFFSVYLYNTDKGNIADDPDIFKYRLNIFAKQIHDLFPKVSIWITEYNSNISSRNFLNDLSYQAAFITKIMTTPFPESLEAIGYYLLSDTSLRQSDSLAFLFGGWGLLSDTNLPKASYHAYTLFSMLGENVIKQTSNYLVTSISTGSIQILMYNYTHPSDEYYSKNITLDDYEHLSDCFDLTIPVHYEITLSDLPDGNYLIREYTINSKESNLFYEWYQINYLNLYHKNDIADLKLRSALFPKLSAVNIIDNHYTASCILGRNEVKLFTLNLYTGGY